MRDLMALQNSVSNGLIAMHQYYATTEYQGEVEQQLAKASGYLDQLTHAGDNDEQIATVVAHLNRFKAAYAAFHREMQAPGHPDWDQLRSDLEAADIYAQLAQQELSAWSAWVRSQVAGVGVQTLDGVHRLNTLQIGFAFVVLFVVALLMAFLFVRVRDQAQ